MMMVYNRDGVPWYKAKAPRLLHRHRLQSSGIDDLRLVERCACGAFRIDKGRWFRLDKRRKR